MPWPKPVKNPSPVWAAGEATLWPRAPTGAATAAFSRGPEHRTADKKSALGRRQSRQALFRDCAKIYKSQTLLNLIYCLLHVPLVVTATDNYIMSFSQE